MGVAPIHWAISNSPSGDDSNSGEFDGTMDNAVKTWQELWDKMDDADQLSAFASPQIVHVSNHSAFVLPAKLTKPHGTSNTFYNAFTIGRVPFIVVPFEEDTDGLYIDIAGYGRYPSWEIDCSTSGAIFTDVFARPQAGYWNAGKFSNVSEIEAFGSYTQWNFIEWDHSGLPAGTFSISGLESAFNCLFIGGDGAGAGSTYGINNIVHTENCHFKDFKNSALYLTSGNTVKNCLFTNVSNSTFGALYLSSPTIAEVVNCTIVGQGPSSGGYGIGSSTSFTFNGVIQNNLFCGIETPLYINAGDLYFTRLGATGFYNCGNNGVVKLDPTEGFSGGLMRPDMFEAIVIDEDPFVNSAGGDFRLKPNSQARGRGKLYPFGCPGDAFAGSPALSCDLGAIQYGAPLLPTAPGFVL